MVGACGFEPQTSSVSGKRSNQLSYAPMSLLPACSPSLTGDLPDASGRSNQLSYAPKFLAPAASPSSTEDLSHSSGRPNAAKLREGQTIPAGLRTAKMLTQRPSSNNRLIAHIPLRGMYAPPDRCLDLHYPSNPWRRVPGLYDL